MCACNGVGLCGHHNPAFESPVINFNFKGFRSCVNCPYYDPQTDFEVLYGIEGLEMIGAAGGKALEPQSKRTFTPIDLSDPEGVALLRELALEGDFTQLPDPDKYTFAGWMMNGTLYPAGSTLTAPNQAELVELSAVYHAKVIYHQNRLDGFLTYDSSPLGSNPRDLAAFGWETGDYLGWSLIPRTREPMFTAGNGPALPYLPDDLPLNLYAVYKAPADDHPNHRELAQANHVMEGAPVQVAGVLDYYDDIDWLLFEPGEEGWYSVALEAGDSRAVMRAYGADMSEAQLSQSGRVKLQPGDRLYVGITFQPEEEFELPVPYVLTVAFSGQYAAGGVAEIEAQTGEIVYLSVMGEDLYELSMPMTVTYDPDALRLIDIAAQVDGCQMGAGAVADTAVTVISETEGEVVLAANEEIPADKTLTGMFTMLEFEALRDGETSAAVEIR